MLSPMYLLTITPALHDGRTLIVTLGLWVNTTLRLTRIVINQKHLLTRIPRHR